MDALTYAETTEDRLFGIPAKRTPRFVRYEAAMDNYEPVPRKVEYGRLVEYDDPDLEVTGQPRYMRSTRRSDIPEGSIVIIDDGLTARPYYGGGGNPGTPAPLYPEGSEPREILCPFPVNPDGKTRPDRVFPDREQVIDYSNWMLGPRKAYHLKITREAVPGGK
jgi:hypothetical protein